MSIAISLLLINLFNMSCSKISLGFIEEMELSCAILVVPLTFFVTFVGRFICESSSVALRHWDSLSIPLALKHTEDLMSQHDYANFMGEFSPCFLLLTKMLILGLAANLKSVLQQSWSVPVWYLMPFRLGTIITEHLYLIIVICEFALSTLRNSISHVENINEVKTYKDISL